MHSTLRSWTRRAVCLAALALANTAFAQEPETAGSPGEWLLRYSTARTLGMGGAYVATADDPLGVVWNPAGLSAMDQNQVRFETARLFENTSINGVSLAVPGSRLPSFGLTILSFGSNEFQRTDEMNNDLGPFGTGETAYLLTVSRAFSPRFALGTNFKFVQQRVEDESAGGFGFDLGGWYDVTPMIRVGGGVANLTGPSIKLRDVAESYPAQIRGGVAAHVLNGRGLISAQVDHAQGLGTRFHAGGEYWIQSSVALRMGVDDKSGTGGCSIRFAPQYMLDYGVADHPLGMTHRVGVSYRFGGFYASSHADPPMFSPTGERAVTQIALNARTKAETESWTLEIVNKSDTPVRRFGGNGKPPAHIQWDGKDETGLPLADGVYRYRLTVKDQVGRLIEGPIREVVISTTGPQGVVPLEPTPGSPEPQR
jgi:hypothetical protein